MCAHYVHAHLNMGKEFADWPAGTCFMPAVGKDSRGMKLPQRTTHSSEDGTENSLSVQIAVEQAQLLQFGTT